MANPTFEHVAEPEFALAAALNRLRSLELRNLFNPDHPECEPTPDQLAALSDPYRTKYVLGANRTGKTQVGARHVAWFFEGVHPYFKRPPEWSDGPITILVVGAKGETIESELWEKKIKRYLAPGTYKEVRVSQALQKIINTENGNRILFQSHHNPHQASKDIQGHTAQVVWLDELPSSSKLFNELRLRVLIDGGIFIATFTPMLRNDEIKEIVEHATPPYSKKYLLKMFDNPLLAGREEEVTAEYAHLPEAERRSRMEGEWFSGGSRIIKIPDSFYVSNPEGYSPWWPHVESDDPACGGGKFGFLLLAEKPGTGVWWAIRDEYWTGDAPSSLIDKCEQETRTVNLTRLIADPAEAWFIKEAAKRKRYYFWPDKNNRKTAMIAGLQQALRDGRLKIAPWCKNLLKELTYAEWNEDESDIKGMTHYHLTHAAMYFCDLMPANLPAPEKKTRDQLLQEADDRRREAKAAQFEKQQRMRLRGSHRWS